MSFSVVWQRVAMTAQFMVNVACPKMNPFLIQDLQLCDPLQELLCAMNPSSA